MNLRATLTKIAMLSALAFSGTWSEPASAAVIEDQGVVALDASTAAVGRGLLIFESNVKWASVSKAWAGKRDAWIAAVKAASTPAQVAAKLLELESAMGWASVQDSWKTRREGWVRELGAAGSDAAVAKLLLELESTTKWSAVEDRWKGLRDAWVADLKKVR